MHICVLEIKWILILILLAACNERPNNDRHAMPVKKKDSLVANRDTGISLLSIDNEMNDENIEDFMVDYFVVMADTSSNYFQLRNTMLQLAQQSNLSIDSLGRYYNASKGIVLPDSSDDELYAGIYYPRRFEGSELSIEYCQLYDGSNNFKTMAIIAGQFTELYSARKQLNKIKKYLPKSHIITAKLYNGCMH